MQVDQRVDQDRRTVFLTLTGTLTDEGLLGLADLMRNTPSVGRDFSLLIDLRFSSGREITTSGVWQMATRPLALSVDARRAVVVPPGLGYGMARMYEQLRGPGGMRVFLDYDEALHWIDAGAGA
jgi:hypothetical protein